MKDELNVLELSKDIERDSKSGALSRELVSKGEKLYAVNPDFPDYIERKTPDGRTELGYWIDNEFVVKGSRCS